MLSVMSAELYREARCAFVKSLDQGVAHLRVPACPAWTVHDLLAHQVHQLAGASDRTFPIVDAVTALAAKDPGERESARRRQEQWIERGVARLRRHGWSRLLRRWRSLVDSAPEVALEGLFPDIVVHLFDLHGVSAVRSDRDRPFVVEALRFWAEYADGHVRNAGRAGLRLDVSDSIRIGSEDAEVVIAGDAFELLRTITGRRSLDQATARLGGVDDRESIQVVAVYGWRDTALEE